MKAACWYGTQKIQVEWVPEIQILNPRVPYTQRSFGTALTRR
jgi:hypothetical protein